MLIFCRTCTRIRSGNWRVGSAAVRRRPHAVFIHTIVARLTNPRRPGGAPMPMILTQKAAVHAWLLRTEYSVARLVRSKITARDKRRSAEGAVDRGDARHVCTQTWLPHRSEDVRNRVREHREAQFTVGATRSSHRGCAHSNQPKEHSWWLCGYDVLSLICTTIYCDRLCERLSSRCHHRVSWQSSKK
jgi:hypothetical protein